MTDDEREEILAEERRHLDPAKRKSEAEELARRVMSLPGRDQIAEWKEKGEATNAARAAWKAEMAAQKEGVVPAWSAIIDTRIDARLAEQRQFFLKVLQEGLDAAAVFAEAAGQKLEELEA